MSVSNAVLIGIVNLLIFLFILIIVKSSNKASKRNTYYKPNFQALPHQQPYYQSQSDAEIKGKLGEDKIHYNLKGLEVSGSKVLTNLYLPTLNGKTTEIDLVVISPFGLFVIESKNYSGWIYGSGNQKYWTQTLKTADDEIQKYKFYNPVFQNQTHIDNLKRILNYNYPVFSVIVFSDRCVLKSIDVHDKDVYITQQAQFNSLIARLLNSSLTPYLNDYNINMLFNRLLPYQLVDNYIKQKHIDDIKNYK